MTVTGPLQAIKEIADPNSVRVVIYANGQIVHAPLGSLILNEADMASNSALKVPTQASVKAYVDNGLLAVTRHLLKTVGLSGVSSANIDIDNTVFTDTYDEYVISIRNVRPSIANDPLNMAVSTDNGTTTVSSLAYTESRTIDSSTAVTVANATASSFVSIFNAISSTQADGGASGELRIFRNKLGTSHMTWHGAYRTSANYVGVIGSAFLPASFNWIRLASAHNFGTDGFISVYGISH